MCDNCKGICPVSDREHRPPWAKLIDIATFTAIIFTAWMVINVAIIAVERLVMR